MTQQPQTTPAPSIDAILNGGGGEQLPTLPLGPAQGWMMGPGGTPVPKHPAKSAAGEFRGGQIVDFEPWAVTKDDDDNPGQRKPLLTRKGAQVWGIRVTVLWNGAKHNLWIDGTTFDDAVYHTRKHALVIALKEAGAVTIERGGELYMAWTRQVDTGRGNPATDWAARYVPAKHAAVNAALAPQSAVPAQPAPAAQPVVTAPAPAAQPADVPF